MSDSEILLNKNRQIDALMLVVCLLLVLILSARAPLDTDLWWHLRAGETTLASGKPLLIDTFSFTRGGSVWMNHSWLAQVGMALLYRGLGFSGLALGVSLAACLTMLLVWQQLNGNALLKAGWMLTCAVFCSLVWAPRPQILSILFLAGLNGLIAHARHRDHKVLWGIVPIFALWSNIHAGYSLGLILLAAIIAGDVMDWMISGRQLKDTGRLAILTALGGLATLVNPNGFNAWRVLFGTVEVQALRQFISEWASPDFHELAQLLFLLFFMVCVIIFLRRQERLSGSELARLVAFGLLAFYARRNIAPFAVVIVPIAADSFNQVLQQSFNSSSPFAGVFDQVSRWFNRANRAEQPLLVRLRVGINLLLAAILFLAGIGKLYVVSHPVMINRYLHETYPVQAMNWLSDHLPEGNLLNEYDWGGYLVWNQPDVEVFIDGRTDLYGDEVMEDWLTIVQAGENYQQRLQHYKIDTVFLRPERALAKLLPYEGWKTVYGDDQAVILQQEAAQPAQ